jgi:hypothetical protein
VFSPSNRTYIIGEVSGKMTVGGFAYVQASDAVFSPVSGVEVANNILSGVTKGNLLVVYFAGSNPQGNNAAPVMTALLDGSGNSFTSAAAISTSLTYPSSCAAYKQVSSVWYMIAAASGNLTLQMAFDSIASGNEVVVYVQEFSGAGSSPFRAASAVAQSIMAGDNDLASNAVASLTGDLVVGFFGFPFTPFSVTPSAPFTQDPSLGQPSLEFLLSATGSQSAVAFGDATEAGSYSGDWPCIAVAFKAG